jgi:hypothetical protein
MRLEISALEALGDDTAVVRGPGVCGRAGYQDASSVNIAITPKPEAGAEVIGFGAGDGGLPLGLRGLAQRGGAALGGAAGHGASGFG